ncbi:MAG: hypothetical protein ABIN66_06140, partial [candidate division WOR-3 bacterium]
MNIFIITTGIMLSQNQFARAYGDTSNDCAYSIVQTSDGGYAVAGWTKSFGAGSADFLVLKLDASGNLIWAKTFGGTSADSAFSLAQTVDGGYIVAGVTYSFGAGRSDILVIKLNSLGNLSWARTIGGLGSERAYSILQNPDTSYILAGRTNSHDTTNTNYLVVKLSSSGGLIWAKTYGDTVWENAHSIARTSDGGYVIAGRRVAGSGPGDCLIIKLGSAGNYQNGKIIGGTGEDYAYSILQTADSGYVIAGYTESFGSSSDLMIVKL